jgi:hypothetical protein
MPLFPALRLSLLAALPLIGLLAACSSPARDPEAAAQHFFEALLEARVRGLPTGEQMKILRPLMSAELDTLIETARHDQLHFMDENPGEKPPWIEGNLFGSLYEGQHAFALGSVSLNDDTARIPVRLEYVGEEDTVRWIDEAVVVNYPEGWRVSDIRFQAPWAFKSGSGLREMLRIQ